MNVELNCELYKGLPACTDARADRAPFSLQALKLVSDIMMIVLTTSFFPADIRYVSAPFNTVSEYWASHNFPHTTLGKVTTQ